MELGHQVNSNFKSSEFQLFSKILQKTKSNYQMIGDKDGRFCDLRPPEQVAYENKHNPSERSLRSGA